MTGGSASPFADLFAHSDPTQVQIADIAETQEDPLARTVRRRLKITRNIERGIPVVYSTEKPGPVKLLPLPDDLFDQINQEGGKPDDYAVLPDFRSRILPVFGTLPAMFGAAMAGFVSLKLADWGLFEPLPAKNRKKFYDRMYRDFRVRDEHVYKAEWVCKPAVNYLSMPSLNQSSFALRCSPICPYLNAEEAGYLLDEVYRGFSVVSRSHDRPYFVRWDPRKPSTLENVVVMTRSEADKHDKAWQEAMAKGEELDVVKLYGEEVVQLVKRRQAQIRREMISRE